MFPTSYRLLFGDFRFVHQSFSSLNSFFTNLKSLKNHLDIKL